MRVLRSFPHSLFEIIKCTCVAVIFVTWVETADASEITAVTEVLL